MTNRDTETRACTLVDLPLLRRISDRAVMLDSETALTRDIHGPGDDLLGTLLLPQRTLQTLVARADRQQVVAQFRLDGPKETQARIVYVAPDLNDEADEGVWLHAFDAMAREAGKLGAHLILGEVDERSPLFETMRHSGFALYARQHIWRRLPGAAPAEDDAPVRVRPAVDADDPAITMLIGRVVPQLLHPLVLPPDLSGGWVYRVEDRARAFINVMEGRHGVFLRPVIHPDVMAQAPAILRAVIANLPRALRLPVYVQVPRYQEWIATALERLGFEAGPTQAVMVRHIAVSLREGRVKAAKAQLKVIPTMVTAHLPPVYEVGPAREPLVV